MFDPIYVRQAQLLVRCLPEIEKQTCFAIKGGTAINLFFRSMPRLSVDIDLTYLPLSGRAAALADITRALEAIAKDVTHRIGGARVQIARSRSCGEHYAYRMNPARRLFVLKNRCSSLRIARSVRSVTARACRTSLAPARAAALLCG